MIKPWNLKASCPSPRFSLALEVFSQNSCDLALKIPRLFQVFPPSVDLLRPLPLANWPRPGSHLHGGASATRLDWATSPSLRLGGLLNLSHQPSPVSLHEFLFGRGPNSPFWIYDVCSEVVSTLPWSFNFWGIFVFSPQREHTLLEGRDILTIPGHTDLHIP